MRDNEFTYHNLIRMKIWLTFLSNKNEADRKIERKINYHLEKYNTNKYKRSIDENE